MKNSSFYTSISPFYDLIFPLNKAQIGFVNKEIGHKKQPHILDIGCGSGNLSLELAQLGYQVQAIDYDEEMIALAEKKKQAFSMGNMPRFQHMDMLQIDKHFSQDSFDSILCFGNTIVHLADMEAIGGFIASMAVLCRPGGKILIQLLHYENIFSNKKPQLPLIENGQIRFERLYHYSDNRTIDFNTSLLIKENGQFIKNSIPLFAIFKSELESLLLTAGMSDISFYGNFKSEALEKSSIPLVVSARK